MLRFAPLATLLVFGLSSWTLAADEPPLTIAASTVGRFAKGGSRYLSMNSAGKADLTIEANSLSQIGRVRRQFDVTQKELTEFRKALDDESFFELEKEYGEIVPDGGTLTLTVIRGEREDP